MPLIKITFDPRRHVCPEFSDIEENYQLLYEFMDRFPDACPNHSTCVAAFCNLDNYYGRKLSRAPLPPLAGHKTLQENWAVGEASVLRLMLQHIFTLFSKQLGLQSGVFYRSSQPPAPQPPTAPPRFTTYPRFSKRGSGNPSRRFRPLPPPPRGA